MAEEDVTHLRTDRDRDDGRTVYEGTIYYDQFEYEFEIDQESGVILSWEAESFFD